MDFSVGEGLEMSLRSHSSSAVALDLLAMVKI